MTDTERDAAALLWGHWQGRTKIDALPQHCRPADCAAGYRAQAALPAVSGRTVVGWKIAATSEAGQKVRKNSRK